MLLWTPRDSGVLIYTWQCMEKPSLYAPHISSSCLAISSCGNMALCGNVLSQRKALFLCSEFSLFNNHLDPKFASKRPSFPLSFRAHKRISISASATNIASDVKVEKKKSGNLSTDNKWGEFAGNVSGEWDGYGAQFTPKGKPVELPENVVPEAFREWEVQVFDWQTQCPTLAEPADFVLAYKLIKLLPTVGCEADAATRYSIDERNVGGVGNKVAAFAYHSSGCYVAVWPMEDNVGGGGALRLMAVEHCLVHPQDRESRVRIIQIVQVDNDGVMSLQNIKVFREQWYGPFTNGEQLGGCAIRESGFASTVAVKGSEITGLWHGSHLATSFQNQTNIFQELVDEKPQKLVRDEQSLVLLPKQLWCSLKETNGETCMEVGWLLEKGRAITSRCNFSKDEKLKEIAIGHETAILEEM